MSALHAVLRRQSYPQVTADAPTHEQLVPFVEAAATIADHGSLKPWRLIELRGDDRVALGTALAKEGGSADKPLRAPLLIAVVAVHRSKSKPKWEQEAVASGVAYMMSLLLDEAGWGVFWRSGDLTRTKRVAKMHKLAKNEKLMGWLYVGGKPTKSKSPKRSKITVSEYLSAP
ncbi:MAG: nitroreductase family protein [Rhodoglobus sp.]